ncbi:hypothetical protein [Microcoleus asticus]|nr:hypothetical protein [Microcoleus asticus]
MLGQIRAIAGNSPTGKDIIEAKLQALLQRRNNRLSKSKLWQLDRKFRKI